MDFMQKKCPGNNTFLNVDSKDLGIPVRES